MFGCTDLQRQRYGAGYYAVADRDDAGADQTHGRRRQHCVVYTKHMYRTMEGGGGREGKSNGTSKQWQKKSKKKTRSSHSIATRFYRGLCEEEIRQQHASVVIRAPSLPADI